MHLKRLTSFIAPRFHAAAIATGVLAVAACNKPETAQPPAHATADPNVQASADYHTQKSTQDFRSVFKKASGYVPERAVEEFEDRQPMDDGAGTKSYGPYVQLATSSLLTAVTDPAFFDNPAGQNVALAVLESATVPAKYERLGLKPTNASNLSRCYYVRRISGTQWKALVFEGDIDVGAAYKSCSLNRNPAPTDAQWAAGYDVAPEKIMDVTQTPAKPFAASDYLNSGTFEEANGNRLAIGFRCADAWCHIGVSDPKHIQEPSFVTDVSPPPGHNGNPAKHSKRSLIRGWFDDQELGVAGGTKHEVRAQIVPEEGIGLLKHAQFAIVPGDPKHEYGQLVAQIYLPKDPTAGSKYATRGLKKGWNELWLGNDGGDKLKYHAWIRPSGSTAPASQLKYAKWTLPPLAPVGGLPGSARWAWIPGDEGAWIPCEDGCCEVSF